MLLNLNHRLLIIINLDSTLHWVLVRHIFVGFHRDIKTANCTVAVAVKLQLSDKLYDLIAKKCGYITYCFEILTKFPIVYVFNFSFISSKC